MLGRTFHLQRLDHVSLNVSDRQRSIDWYRDVLGLELTNEPKRDDWPAFMGEFGVRDPDGHTVELTTYEL